MRLWPLALGLALACTPTAADPTTSLSSPAQPTSGAARAVGADCDEARQRELLFSFFEGYRVRDADRVLAAFRVGEDLSVQTAPFGYYDSVDGEAVDIRDAPTLRVYLERRWALDDRFDLDVESIALSARFPNPTFSFGRTSVQGTYAGNAKFVCTAGFFSGVVTSSIATSRSDCPETSASPGVPANSNTASFSRRWYASADQRIWASKPERFYVGGNKVLWERPAGERLEVQGQPRGARGLDLKASLPSGYEAVDYQASGLDFPVAGCWEVVARAGTSELRFVADVYPQSYLPPAGACVDLAAAVQNSRWVITAQVLASEPDRPGFVRHRTKVVRAWMGNAAAGHDVHVWQDALFEPVLERDRSYLLFLAVPSFGSPNTQYGLTRIFCPLRTIVEIQGAELRRPPRYSPEDWIWRGAPSLTDLERELTRLLPRTS